MYVRMYVCMCVCMYVLMHDYIYDIRGDQKPRGPPLTYLTLWANLALASMYIYIYIYIHHSLFICLFVYGLLLLL